MTKHQLAFVQAQNRLMNKGIPAPILSQIEGLSDSLTRDPEFSGKTWKVKFCSSTGKVLSIYSVSGDKPVRPQLEQAWSSFQWTHPLAQVAIEHGRPITLVAD